MDDRLHYGVSNELSVFIRDVVDRRLCGRTISTTPVLSYHVLKVNNTYIERDLKKKMLGGRTMDNAETCVQTPRYRNVNNTFHLVPWIERPLICVLF